MKQNNYIPPKLARRFLLWFLRDDLVEEVEGDLEEQFIATVKEESILQARMRYWYEVFRYFRPFALKYFSFSYFNHNMMFKHYFKISWRNLLNNKGYSLINIGGLAVGMTVAMLIGLWIHYETSFDAFHNNIDRIGIIRKHSLFNDIKSTQLAVPLPLYEELKDNYPEIKRISRFKGHPMGLKADDQILRKTGQYVDPDFLEMFSISLIKGNVKTALNDPKSMVLTESLAEVLFGEEDPIDKVVRIDNQYDAKVTGVIRDFSNNSFFNYIEFLAPFEYTLANSYLKRFKDNWGSNVIWTFLELNEHVPLDKFSEKISLVNLEHDPKSREQKLSIQPFEKFHLYDEYENWENVGGKITYVRMFGIVGVLVLFIACINFMNLATARSEKRAREVGIRKSIGSQKMQLIIQFFSESVMMAFFAFLLSIALIFLCLPYLETLGFSNFTLDTGNAFLWVAGLMVCLITGMIAGSYPALYLSSFQPVKTLKGTFRQGRGPVVFRKLLVVSQYTVSIGLIISTLVVFTRSTMQKTAPSGIIRIV